MRRGHVNTKGNMQGQQHGVGQFGNVLYDFLAFGCSNDAGGKISQYPFGSVCNVPHNGSSSVMLRWPCSNLALSSNSKSAALKATSFGIDAILA